MQIYLILLIAILLHIGALNNLKIFGVKPDILLVSVVFFALYLGPGAGLESGIAAGLLKDIFAVDFFWVNTFTLALTGLAVGLVNDKFFKESKKTVFAVVLLSMVFSMSLHYFLEKFLSRNLALGYFDFILSSIIPASLYTALASIPLYVVFVNTYHLKEADDYI